MNRHHGDDNSQSVNEFHGLMLPEPGKPVGYAALIDNFGLRVPFPSQLTMISDRHVRISTDAWQILTPRHEPADTAHDGRVTHQAVRRAAGRNTTTR